MRERVLIRSGGDAGHHATYAGHLTAALAARGVAADVALPAAAQPGAGWDAVAATGARLLTVPPASRGRAGAAHVRAMRRLLAHGYDAFADMYVDSWFWWLTAVGPLVPMPRRTASLLMAPSFHVERPTTLRRHAALAVKSQAVRRWIARHAPGAVLVNDPLVADHVERAWPALSDRMRRSGDPVTLADSAGSAPLPPPFVLVYGQITGRKRVGPLLDGAIAVPGLSVVLAGRQDDATRALLAASPSARSLAAAGRLLVLDRFIDGAEEAALFRSAAVLWTAYGGFVGMSGVALLAARAGCPSVSAPGGTMEVLARRHRLGPVESGGVTATLRAALDGDGFDRASAAALADWNSVEHFQRSWLEALNIPL